MIRGYATDSNLELNIEHGKKLQPHEKEMVKNINKLNVVYKKYAHPSYERVSVFVAKKII